MPRNEANRPRYHVTPPKHWMNDPNGLVHYDGEYHLFYQHNPYGTAWGHMSWGHAVSPDLVRWRDLPIALMEAPDKGYTIFSGSAVVDWRNSSGFGRDGQPPLVAVFTANYRAEQRLEDIHIAYSTDRGRTFSEYAGNPVLHTGSPKFGDPKVFWHEASGQWILAAILGVEQGCVVLYGSSDLKTWRELSRFEAPAEAPGIWECPDLFPLALDGDTQRTFWVLKVNCTKTGAADRSRYFLGQFDGRFFRRHASLALNPQQGDLYAEVTYNDLPAADGRRILIGWIRQQASDLRPWTGMQSVARELSLRSTSAGLRLCQMPVAELQRLRSAHWTVPPLAITGESSLLTGAGCKASECEVRVLLAPGADACGLRLALSAGQAEIGYAGGSLYVDRPGAQRVALPLALHGGCLALHVLIDRSVVEVFGGQGEATIAVTLEPDGVCEDVRVFSQGGASHLRQADVWTLDCMWSEGT